MEVSVIRSSQTKLCKRSEFLGNRELGFCVVPQKPNNLCFVDNQRRSCDTRFAKSSLRFRLHAALTEPVRSDKVVDRRGSPSISQSLNGVRVYVGLPLDAVSDCNTINHERAIGIGLKALKLLGVEGVELPVWWGIAEKEATGKYEWSGYLKLAEMVQAAGLKLHVSFCFHACKEPNIPLPEWVNQLGESDRSIFYTDRTGKHYDGCLSLAVDELPVLNGKTPVQVYQEFCESFKSSFSQFIGSTITGVTMSLGPEGELRYPSWPTSKGVGVGEFQCYNKHMLNLLKQHAELSGNSLWGLGGPHDAADQLPQSNSFFKDLCGSWESPYGDFFLSWYSNQLLSHGNRLLSLAVNVFGNSPVTIHGKVPLVHSWYKTRSHPTELTAGFYNTINRDGYKAVAEIFAKNLCTMILPGMDLSDNSQPLELLSSPESLLAQISTACKNHGVEISGQNSLVSKAPESFDQIKKHISKEDVVSSFIYQRMGADFFSPDHFPSFTNFVRNLYQPEAHSDDLGEEGDETANLLQTSSEPNPQMQAV